MSSKNADLAVKMHTKFTVAPPRTVPRALGSMGTHGASIGGPWVPIGGPWVPMGRPWGPHGAPWPPPRVGPKQCFQNKNICSQFEGSEQNKVFLKQPARTKQIARTKQRYVYQCRTGTTNKTYTDLRSLISDLESQIFQALICLFRRHFELLRSSPLLSSLRG